MAILTQITVIEEKQLFCRKSTKMAEITEEEPE
jgi:hypothetical protein